MRITDRLRSNRPFFSFEFFPPKTEDGVDALMTTLRTLKTLDPAYVSVTYGAGGSTRERSLAIVKRIRDDVGIDVMAHVTCAGSSAEDLRSLFRELEAAGVENVFALRGDAPRGTDAFVPAENGFAYASDLVHLLEREFDFCIGGACYPEKHPEAPSLHADLEALERKVAAGTRFLITQLFFDNAYYFEFVARARARGITIPIIPGIMPITNYDQIARFTKMCEATIPARLLVELDARRDEPDAVAELGGRVCHAAMHRTAREGRTGRAFLHAQSLAGDARRRVGALRIATRSAARSDRRLTLTPTPTPRSWLPRDYARGDTVAAVGGGVSRG